MVVLILVHNVMVHLLHVMVHLVGMVEVMLEHRFPIVVAVRHDALAHHVVRVMVFCGDTKVDIK